MGTSTSSSILGVCSGESEWTSHSSVAAPPAKAKLLLFTVLFFGHGQLQSFPFIPHSFSFFYYYFFFISHLPSQGVLHFVLAHDSPPCSAALLEIKVSPLADRFRLSRGSASGEGGQPRRVVTAECERGLRTTLPSCPGHVDGNVIGRGRGLKLGSHLCPLSCHKKDNFQLRVWKFEILQVKHGLFMPWNGID